MRLRHPALADQRTEPIVWFLVVAVVLEGLIIAGGGVYLTHRQALAESRNALTRQQVTALRQGICTVLDPLRADQVAGVAKARAYPFPAPTGGHEPLCRPPVVPPLMPHHPTPTPTPASPTSVVVVPQPRPTVIRRTVTARPRPTVTRTVRPHPTRHPSPTPKPSRSCLLSSVIPPTLCL